MAKPKTETYSVRVERDDAELLFVSIWSGVKGGEEKMITSWRTPSISDAMFDAGFELSSLIGDDLY